MNPDEEPTTPDGRAVSKEQVARGQRPVDHDDDDDQDRDAGYGRDDDGDDDDDEDDRDRGDDGNRRGGRGGGSGRPRRRMRRAVLVPLVALLVVGGFAAGVVTDRYVGVPCTDCPPRPGEAAPLVGTIASAGNGTLTVRTVDGALVVVRTSTSPAVVRAEPAPGGLATGTPVAVQGTRDADGALTVTRVEVTAPR